MATKISANSPTRIERGSPPASAFDDGMNVPPPSAAHAGDGMDEARKLARRYMPNAVFSLAGIAFASDS
jgi:hypothetical protein